MLISRMNIGLVVGLLVTASAHKKPPGSCSKKPIKREVAVGDPKYRLLQSPGMVMVGEPDCFGPATLRECAGSCGAGCRALSHDEESFECCLYEQFQSPTVVGTSPSKYSTYFKAEVDQNEDEERPTEVREISRQEARKLAEDNGYKYVEDDSDCPSDEETEATASSSPSSSHVTTEETVPSTTHSPTSVQDASSTSFKDSTEDTSLAASSEGSTEQYDSTTTVETSQSPSLDLLSTETPTTSHLPTRDPTTLTATTMTTTTVSQEETVGFISLPNSPSEVEVKSGRSVLASGAVPAEWATAQTLAITIKKGCTLILKPTRGESIIIVNHGSKAMFDERNVPSGLSDATGSCI